MKMGQWLGIIALIVSLYVMWRIRQLLLLVFTAIVLATAINHLVQRFQRSRLKRTGAVLLSLAIVGGVFIFIFLLIVPPFIEQFQDLIALLPLGLEQIQLGINWLEDRFGPRLPEIPDATGLIRQIQPLGANLLQRMLDFFSTSITFLAQLLLVLVLTLMLLANPQPYRQVFIRFFPSFYRHRVDEILTRCADGLGAWTTGALIEMVFIATLSGLGLWLLRVPLTLAHAVLAGLLNFIPNIGPTLSVVLPMTIGFLDAPWKALAVLILYIVIQNIESYWLTPTVMANQVSLLPAITLTSQLFFTTFFGALGLVMALPLAVVAKIWIEEALFKDILDKWQESA
ncbi:AI-2E family transporter [Leptolyngbya sp. NK1-12]|uniref:AI-2E family transporter n=1 Tax=Leptolyngbya sp. NK1-12 TaxID=2547451 RepID=A0AA97AIV7_9CYAN|nr:AI-2E family transporter [Leptolyngbya sp. NK1-12]WNZ27105.1 AI-2E family transporter [Leptolyngbya sp. NK1-12]